MAGQKEKEHVRQHRALHALLSGSSIPVLDHVVNVVTEHLPGSNRKVLLQDFHHGYWFFKPEQGDQPDTALVLEHALAAAQLAPLLGVRTPKMCIASYRGERGLCMKWDPAAITLDEAVAAGKCSERDAWDVFNEAGAVLDWVVGNGDRKLAHGLVPHDAAFPVNAVDVSLIDLDMAFSPEEYRPDPPHAIPGLQQQRARALVRNPDVLMRCVGTLLTAHELAQLFDHLTLVAKGHALRSQGELHVF